MEELLTHLIIGIFSGGVYSLIALGLVIIFKTTKVVNFAVGELIIMGGLITISLMNTGLPPWAAIILSIAIGGVIGLSLQKVILSSFIKRPILDTLIVTCFIIYLAEGVNKCGWGAGIRFFRGEFIPQWELNIGDTIISSEIIWPFIMAMALSLIFIIIFQYTKLGLGLKAVADADKLARSKGISVSSAHSTVWVLGGIVAVVGGIFLSLIHGSAIDPTTSEIGLKAIPVVFLGGLESPTGAIVAGIIIGVVESLVGGYASSSWASIAPFLILLIILLIRPQGLLGQRMAERV
jgi:branched-chain amino acid transport system permease protein